MFPAVRLTDTAANETTTPVGTSAPPTLGSASVTVRHAALTHTGSVREANEDNYLALPDVGVYLVADGMGGHVAGQLASEICVQTVAGYFEESPTESLIDEDGHSGLSKSALAFAESLLLANRRIHERAEQQPEFSGMGTTAVGVRIIGTRMAIAHAGDSRCYRFRAGELAQLTADHSLSNFLFALGREMEARYAEQTMSNVIMRALGLEPEVAVDTTEVPLFPGDRILLCSDGLSDLVSDAEIAAQLADPLLTLDQIVTALVGMALDAGGRDNITVILVEATGEPDVDSASFSETLEVPVAAVMGTTTGDDLTTVTEPLIRLPDDLDV